MPLLDEMGISVIDEADVDKQAVPEAIAEDDFEPVDVEVPIEPVEEEPIEEDKLIEKELVEAESSRRVDDPIRTYLTQMGEIPLLNREDEISLARKSRFRVRPFGEKCSKTTTAPKTPSKSSSRSMTAGFRSTGR